MKKNAFTLVELLAVIVILAIILIIAVPGVLSIISKTKDNAYDRQIDMIKEAAKNYLMVEHNAVIWQGTDSQVTILPVSRLQQEGYLDKKIMDPRTNSEIRHLAVRAKKTTTTKTTYEIIASTTNEIQSPHLTTDMIPIVWSGSTWVKADFSNKRYLWYDYDNQQWANVATVTEDVRQTLLEAPIGTEVPMDKINTMLTWVPRFKYKLFNVDETVNPVGNPNLAGNYMINIQFETSRNSKSKGSQNGEWLTHPAFTFGDQELEGFWVAKFETGYNETPLANIVEPFKVVVKPNVYSWRSIDLVNMYKNARGIQEAENPFGITQENDPHLMKNTEWGAIVYLTASQYGKQGNNAYVGEEKQVRTNNNNLFLTGCGADRQNASPTDICNPYDTVYGQTASTTGNITGIYDMSGGTPEYVAAVMKTEDGTGTFVGSSGFDQNELNQISQENKYFDVYEYIKNWGARNLGLLGDCTKEMGPFDVHYNSWYNNVVVFINEAENRFFFVRGTSFLNQDITGIYQAERDFGAAYYQRTYRITMI